MVLRTLHSCSVGFRSGLIAGHSRTLQLFALNHFWGLFEVCFGKPMADRNPAFWHWALNYTPEFFRYNEAMQTVKAFSARSSKAILKYLWTSTVFDHRDHILFSEGLSLLFVNSTMKCLIKKALFWSHWFTRLWRPQVGVSTRLCVSSGVLLFNCVAGQLEFGSVTRFIIQHSNNL